MILRISHPKFHHSNPYCSSYFSSNLELNIEEHKAPLSSGLPQNLMELSSQPMKKTPKKGSQPFLLRLTSSYPRTMCPQVQVSERRRSGPHKCEHVPASAQGRRHSPGPPGALGTSKVGFRESMHINELQPPRNQYLCLISFNGVSLNYSKSVSYQFNILSINMY